MPETRFVPAVATAVVGVLSAASIGLAVPAASASPSYGGTSHCGFTKTTYHDGQTVRFHTGHNFKHRSHVTVRVSGPHYHHRQGGWADRHGEVKAHFKLGKHAKSGRYNLVVTGKGGARSTGHFKVER